MYLLYYRTMRIEIYTRCPNCGIEGLKVGQISRWSKQYGHELTINKVDRGDEYHASLLEAAGLPIDYRGVAVFTDNNDARIEELRKWKQ